MVLYLWFINADQFFEYFKGHLIWHYYFFKYADTNVILFFSFELKSGIDNNLLQLSLYSSDAYI